MIRVLTALSVFALCALPNLSHAEESSKVSLEPYSRLRLGFDLVQADPNVPFVGQNDGFLVDQARFGFKGKYADRISWVLVADAITRDTHELNNPVSQVSAALRDAYLHWHATDFFNIWLGQLFMPADYEGMISRRELNFVNRSVASIGVFPGRGYEVAGLSAGRQQGMILGAKDLVAGILHLDYRIALANGNGPNRSGNDNEQPAFYSRLGAGLGEWAQLSFGFQYNPRTVGELPNLYTENDVVALSDLHFDLWGVDVLVQGIWRQTSYDTSTADSDTALGLTSWLVLNEPFGVHLYHFKPGIRISYLDPSSFLADDQLREMTASLRYDAPIELPLAFIVDYTWLVEEASRALTNDRLVAMFQIEY